MGVKTFFKQGKQKVFINVFVTKSGHFRAKIDNKKDPVQEVTINGRAWNEGKGTESLEPIKRRCGNILQGLIEDYERGFCEN